MKEKHEVKRLVMGHSLLCPLVASLTHSSHCSLARSLNPELIEKMLSCLHLLIECIDFEHFQFTVASLTRNLCRPKINARL